ncbi:hypothetical protein B0H13DRAFT_2316687 [Mycena leptocephala]|nr:hypothetical protein B0H13DRAFT_2316687 [Mycena leptocephala]
MSWDVTPPVNLTFLGVSSYSGARTHILLDRLGKTQSHAFVELSSETAASSILRGENRATPILGVGHRARTITLTRSCQPAFMAVLFPPGTPWSGAPPSRRRASLPSELEVMGESEPRRPPVAHTHAERPFVKTPSLPYYALASILANVRADRHILCNITFVAIQVLRTGTLCSSKTRPLGRTELHERAGTPVPGATRLKIEKNQMWRHQLKSALCEHSEVFAANTLNSRETLGHDATL